MSNEAKVINNTSNDNIVLQYMGYNFIIKPNLSYHEQQWWDIFLDNELMGQIRVNYANRSELVAMSTTDRSTYFNRDQELEAILWAINN